MNLFTYIQSLVYMRKRYNVHIKNTSKYCFIFFGKLVLAKIFKNIHTVLISPKIHHNRITRIQFTSLFTAAKI